MTEEQLLEQFYDNQFGKPFNGLSKEEKECLKGSTMFKMYIFGRRTVELRQAIGLSVKKLKKSIKVS